MRGRAGEGDRTLTTDHNDAPCLHDGVHGAGESGDGIAGIVEEGGRRREGCVVGEGDEQGHGRRL